MFHEGVRLPGASASRMSASGLLIPTIAIALLLAPAPMVAQRGGGGGGGGGIAGRALHGRPLICVHDCPDTPDAVSADDGLDNFEHIMAVQASSDQSAAFAKVTKDAQDAANQLQVFRDLLQKTPASSQLSDHITILDQGLEGARNANQNFVAALTPVQKSDLKDITERLEQADSELANQIKTLDRVFATPKTDNEQIGLTAAALDKALASVQSGQLALGREMSIILPSAGQELTFNLPSVTSSIDLAGQPISIPASGIVSRTSVADGHNLFSLKLVADLSDLQQNMTAVLRAQHTRNPLCGERIQILQGTLIPAAPASLVLTHLHYERWICPPGFDEPTQIAVADGALEIKFTPSIENAGLQLASEVSHVDADGSLRDSLLSGSLGVKLREQISASLLSAMQKGADLKATLSPAAQEFATIQKAQFQDAGAGRLTLVLNGQLQLSDEQAKQFSIQLKQRLSAQATSPQ
jgi:hypothetical protein